jgi:hypothetical protein
MEHSTGRFAAQVTLCVGCLFFAAGADARNVPQAEIFGGWALTGSDMGAWHETFTNGLMGEVAINFRVGELH